MKRSFYARWGLLILAISFFLLPAAGGGALRALRSNRNDVKEWLPAKYDETKVFQWFRRHFAGEEFILVSWEGCTLTDQRLKILVDKLVPPVQVNNGAQPGYFLKGQSGPDVLERLTTEPINLSEEKSLQRLKGSLIGPDLETTCAVLTLSDAGKASPRAAVKHLLQVATQECDIPESDLHMGGPPVDNAAIDVAGEKSLYRLAGFAAGIGLLISWWCLRSGRLIALVFITGTYAAACSLAMVWYTGSKMNAILLTMPSLVYVATISGAIHLANYYRDTVHSDGVAGAPGRAIRHAALPLSLATTTTAFGLLTLMYSELVPIQLFGLYSAIGVALSMLLLVFLMPSAMQFFPLPEPDRDLEAPADKVLADPIMSKRWRIVGRQVVRHHWLVTAACIALLVVCGYGFTRIRTSVHLMRLFPPDARILADYKWLEENLGELVPMEVVLKIDPAKCKLNFLQRMELVQRVQTQIEAVPTVGSALSAVTFAPELPDLPRNKKQPVGISGAIGHITRINLNPRGIWNRELSKHRDEYEKGGYLAKDEDGQDLWRISARVGALKDIDYGQFVSNIKAAVEPELAKLDKKGVTGVEPVYTGLVPLVYKAQRSLLDGLILGFITDFILITIVMMIVVRSVSAGIILALPTIFPAVVIFGLMGWTGVVVDIGTVMAPSVALGVTVDDVVHFMLKCQGGLAKGLNRRTAVMLAYKGCARPMYQSWGVIGLGLSVFALSQFTPTQRFGYLMVTLLSAALIGNLLLLPALLSGPLGYFFGRKHAAKRAERLRLGAADTAASALDSDAAVASTAESGAGHGRRIDPHGGRPGLERGRRSVRT